MFGRFLSPEGCLLLIEGDHATSPTGLNELPYGLTLSGASDCPEHVMHTYHEGDTGPCSMHLMSLTREASH